MENSDQRGTEVEADQPGERGRGCYYTMNTLMVLFLLIPALILLILFVLWLIPD